MKTIGVLGGLGPQATMDFEERIHRIAQQLIPQKGNQGYPPLVVSYFREPPIILPPGGSLGTTLPPLNPHLLDHARRLGAWADFLVIPSNGIHIFQDQIEQAAGRKVLSMVDAAVGEVQRRNLKHVGIVDFRPRQLSVYPRPLDQAGVRWEFTPNAMLDPLYAAVLAIDEGREGSEETEIANDVVAYMRAQKVDGILLACTEIPFMLPGSDTEADIINPLQLLAEAAVRFALEQAQNGRGQFIGAAARAAQR